MLSSRSLFPPLSSLATVALLLCVAGRAMADDATVVVLPSTPLAPLPPPSQAAPPPQPPPIIILQQYTDPRAPAQAPAAPQAEGRAVESPQAPLVGPRIIRPWDDSQTPPEGYHEEERARTGLVAGGAAMFGSMYLITALGASVANDNGGSVGALYAPGIGPFIEMSQTNSSTAGFFLALDGAVQLGGIAMFVAGLALPRREFVRNDYGLHLQVAPILAKNQTGMGLKGAF